MYVLPVVAQSPLLAWCGGDCGSPVVKISDHGRYVMSPTPVPLKTRRAGQRCTLNLSRAPVGCGHGSLVVKVMDSWPVFQEFEPSAAEHPPCREGGKSGNLTVNLS
ncbi:hypothetical protein TNCV_4854721 [Trichonephila clavipes]|nr:hypothetical protein TNCV_4854721 [Trichonephila clavipes]